MRGTSRRSPRQDSYPFLLSAQKRRSTPTGPVFRRAIFVSIQIDQCPPAGAEPRTLKSSAETLSGFFMKTTTDQIFLVCRSARADRLANRDRDAPRGRDADRRLERLTRRRDRQPHSHCSLAPGSSVGRFIGLRQLQKVHCSQMAMHEMNDSDESALSRSEPTACLRGDSARGERRPLRRTPASPASRPRATR
jgi:hypothetical protein